MKKENDILQTALICLSKRGYEGTSMRDIAAEAHINASAIYYYFPTKEALFEKVYEEILTTLRKDIIPIYRITKPSMRLRALIRYEFFKRNMLAALLNYFVAQKKKFHKGPDDGYVPQGAYRHFLDFLQMGIDAGNKPVHTSPFDAKIIAHIMNGFILEYANRPLSTIQREHMVEAIASFIESVGTHSDN